MKIKKLQVSLKGHEKVTEQAFQAKFFNKMNKDSSVNNKVKEKWKNKWNEDVDIGKGSRSQGETSNNGAT